MEEVKLDVQVRKGTGTQKAKLVRREEDMIPGIVYGGKESSVGVKIDRRLYERIRREHHGEIVFHLNVLDQKKGVADYPAIVKEEQHDCVTDQVIHVDFKRISLTEKVEVSVPLVPKGEPIGVKQGGGSLDHILWELDIICLPMDIPEGIEVEVSHLQVNESIHLKDVVLPKGVETKHDLEAIVFSVAPPMKEEVPTEAPAGAEPEVIQKEKAAKEGEAAPEAAAGSAPAAQAKK